MNLTIDCEWESAPGVRAPELRATWARLRIAVGDEIVTLAKQRESPTQVRESIDVAAYPLAEWLALNWWMLEAASHRPEDEGLSIIGAGEGFPWPAMTLRSDRQQMWIRASPRHEPDLRVSLLGTVDAVLGADEARRSLSRFIDSTVRRLEESDITGTLLQDEWATIQEADNDERAFAIVASSWGFDPYDIRDDATDVFLSAAETLKDDALLAELARAVPFDALQSADRWLRDALSQKLPTSSPSMQIPSALVPLRNVSGRTPWREGYRRARSLRSELGLESASAVAIQDFVSLTQASASPPGSIEALARIGRDFTSAITGPDIDPVASRGRFIGARTLARRITDPHARSSLVTRGNRYSDKFERAFAAEFLAPASGVQELLGGDFSEQSQARVAKEFGVSELVIERQVENQLAA